MNQFFSDYLQNLHQAASALDSDKLDQLYNLIDAARRDGRQVFVLGNGGSAATSSHWVCDFAKGANVEGARRLKIFAPVENMSILTAYGNDVSYDCVLSEQMKNLLNPGDLVISMSVSGSSPNLLRAHELAQPLGCTCVSIIGDYNGKLKACSDLVIEVPSRNYGIVEDIHLILGHMFSQCLKKSLEEA